MPRLRHRVTGVVVNVGDDVAARLPGEWEPTKAHTLEADQDAEPEPVKPAPAKKRPARRRSSKN